MVNKADIIIIGAGIAGAGLAAMIAQDKKIIILEGEDHPGYHSTGRSAASLIQNYGNSVIRQLTRLSRPYFEQPPSSVCKHALLQKRGCLFLETDPDTSDLTELMENQDGLHEFTQKEALALVPVLKPEAFCRAAYEPGAGGLDVAALHQGWLKTAQKQGVGVRVNARVLSIRKKKHCWHLQTSAGLFEAEIIVNAAGAWADQVAEMAGVSPMGIIPRRRTLAVFPEPDEHDVSQWPLFGSTSGAWYCKPEMGKILVSPADEDPVEAQDVYVDDMVMAEGLYRFEQAVDFSVTRVEHSWAGLRCFAPDESPVVGFAPDNSHFFWHAGQGGYGIQTSPALSGLAASLLRGDTPGQDFSSDLVKALSPVRFTDSSC